MRQLLLAALAALVLASPAMAAAPPVIKQQDKQFGSILATAKHHALYYWSVEKDFRVHCTGSCARAWPPLLVRSAALVPRHVAGVKGVFGVRRRPGGTLQVTYNRLGLYTYADEGPNQVLCNNVNGWFVVRV